MNEWDGSWDSMDEWLIEQTIKSWTELDAWIAERKADRDRYWADYLEGRRHGDGTSPPA